MVSVIIILSHSINVSFTLLKKKFKSHWTRSWKASHRILKTWICFPIVCGFIEEFQAGLCMSFRLIVLEAV